MRLSKERLHPLTPEDLSGVVAGLPIPTWYDGCVTTVYPSVPDCWKAAR